MMSISKRLPTGRTLAAVAFLLLQTVCALLLPYLTATIVDGGIAKGDLAYIWQQGGIMLTLTIISLVGAVCNTYLSAKIAYRLGVELRGDLYRKVLSFSKAEYDKFGAASLMTRNTNDVTQVQNLVEMGLKFLILAPLYLVGGILLTGLLAPKLAMVFAATIPFLAAGTMIIYRFANPLYNQMQTLLDKLNLYFREGLTGVKVIRAFAKEDKDFGKYKQVNQEYTRTSITAATLMSVLLPLITMLLSVATVLVVWLGAQGVSKGTMEVGAMMAAISYGVQIMMGFGMLSMAILAIPRGRVSAARLQEVLDTELSITDLAREGSLSEATYNQLEFDHVNFRYAGAARKVLQDISFSVSEGETLAIIGSTGDGKSSLVNLINRLYDVESGRVCIGGLDIRKMTQKELREKVSIAPQKSMLFMGTIRDNLLMAKPAATDEEIWTALEMASAVEFINSLDQAVEKNGGNFSGGQKQRLCIARTLLKDADLYIFDDSFSALDFKTDAIVRSAMKEKLNHAITVIVAQRVSTVQSADKILVLNGGKAVGFGTHDELLHTCTVYGEIVESQTERRLAS